MKVGFIGAGRVGCSLGRYLLENNYPIAGYYSKSPSSAAWAADFTKTISYHTMKQLVEVSDVLFLTVPDSAIEQVYGQLKEENLSGKILCHCSGAMASSVFADIEERGAFAYSIHPFYAISNKETSYLDLGQAFFTVEGSPEHLEDMCGIFRSAGNRVQVIDAEQKVLYHAAASAASNFMVALSDYALGLLSQCGFTKEAALGALGPIMRGNMETVLAVGPEKALTGPIARNDQDTVRKHMAAINEADRGLYRELARRTLTVAKAKNPQVDYQEMEEILQ